MSSSDALLLRDSKLLGLEYPLVYASNSYEMYSREVIDMFISAGMSTHML